MFMQPFTTFAGSIFFYKMFMKYRSSIMEEAVKMGHTCLKKVGEKIGQESMNLWG